MIDEYAKIKLYYLDLLKTSINHRRATFGDTTELLKTEEKILNMLNEVYDYSLKSKGIRDFVKNKNKVV